MNNRVFIERNIALLLPLLVVALAVKTLGRELDSGTAFVMIGLSSVLLTVFLCKVLEPRRSTFAERDALDSYLNLVGLASVVISAASCALVAAFI